MGLELHTFYYLGRCPKPVRLEETSKSRLASECIIADANRSLLQSQSYVDQCFKTWSWRLLYELYSPFSANLFSISYFLLIAGVKILQDTKYSIFIVKYFHQNLTRRPQVKILKKMRTRTKILMKNRASAERVSIVTIHDRLRSAFF